MITFDPGNMSICECCRHENICDEGGIVYCALTFKDDKPVKMDSSQCVRWHLYELAHEVSVEVSDALAKLPTRVESGPPRDYVYRRVIDALADFFDPVWTYNNEAILREPQIAKEEKCTS